MVTSPVNLLRIYYYHVAMSLIRRGVILCIFVIAVSASVTEQILKVPLFEVGQLWVSSLVTCYERLVQSVASVIDVTSPLFYVALLALAFVLYYAHGLLLRPLNRVRILGDLGYLPDGKFSMKEIANDVKKRRVVGDIPPVYPNGWFGLIESWKLKDGESVNLSVMGEQLAVFRDEKGVAHVLNAYCPHMGANLAVGGRVIGDCIECPFHGWKFRGHDGKCTHIPYAEKVPDIARVKSWPCLEINQWVHFWYHAEGAEPNWKLPDIPEITDGTWRYYGRTEHYINAHIEETPENGADIAHLPMVHMPVIAAGNDLTTMWTRLLSFAWHTWVAGWAPNAPPEEHIGTLTLEHHLNVFGYKLPFMSLKLSVKQIGPGVVYLYFDSFFGKGVFIETLTPVEPMVQKFVNVIYMHWALPTVIGKIFLLSQALHIERDIMIWNNKRYIEKPMFVKSKEDAQVARHRRWYSQFYSENSPRLKFRKDTLDW